MAEVLEYSNIISAEGQDSLNKCHGYDAKTASDNEAQVLELWGMWSTSSLPLVVVCVRALSVG